MLQVIANRPNVCKQLHMPAQSGSTTMLERMRRGYTRQAYDDLVHHVREMVPGVALSTDIISGWFFALTASSARMTACMQTDVQVAPEFAGCLFAKQC